MRLSLLLLLSLLQLAGRTDAADLMDRVHVIRLTTDRAGGGSPNRQTLSAPALPVGPDGLLMVVGFSIEPGDEPSEAVRVTAIAPDGREIPARLLGGDKDLNCTFFRMEVVPTEPPAPVSLARVELRVGDRVWVLGRHGELFDHAPRRLPALIEAVKQGPDALYALEEVRAEWRGSIVTDKSGAVVGFLDLKPTVRDGTGVMLGVGSQTLVVVPADLFAARAAHPPAPRVREKAPPRPRARPWIGVTLAPCDADHEAYFGIGKDEKGAFVTSVAPGSPAEVAGLRLFDLVHSMGELKINFENRGEFQRLLREVHELALGAPLETTITRFLPKEEGVFTPQPQTLTITLSPRPLSFDETPEIEVSLVGIRVRPAASDWLRGARLPEDLTGLVATRVESASAARLAGLVPGDLILEVDRQPVADAPALVALLEEAKAAGREKSIFFVRRGSATIFLPVELN